MATHTKRSNDRTDYQTPITRSGSRPSHHRRPKYHLLPLIILGVIIYAVIVLVLGLVWGSIAYFAKLNLENATIVPFIIFQLSLFVSCIFISVIVRGKTIVPSLCITVILLVISFYMSDNITTKAILLKTAISLTVLLTTFLIAKTKEKRKKRLQYHTNTKRRMSA